MPLRGPGSGRQKAALEALEQAPPRRLPWKRKGLNRAERIIAFIEWLPVTKGIRVGKKMRLLPDQKEFIRKVYRERPRVRIGIDSKPRGNGKTGLTAGLALAHLLGPEAEQRGEIYSAAVDRTQSAKIYAEMAAIIDAVPEFSARTNTIRHYKQIEVMSGDGAGSVYEALSADGRKGNSLAPSLWIYDELAQVNDFELLDNLETALGKRKRSLGLIISTQAESDDHRLSLMIDDGLTGVDPSIVVHLLAAPQDADPFAPDVIASVNPAFDIFLNREDVFAEARKAQRLRTFEPQFRNKRLNQRVDFGADRRLVTRDEWMACNLDKNGNPLPSLDRAALAGRKCFGGLDLSGSRDLTALVLVFPDDADPATYTSLAFYWTPLGYLPERRPAEQERFKLWIADRHIFGVEGLAISNRQVAQDIVSLAAEFDIEDIAFDPARYKMLKPELDDLGCEIEFTSFQQGFISMGPALDLLAQTVLDRRLRHASPVLTSNIANAIVVGPDAAGNLKFDKGRSNDRSPVRIDGAIALTMALSAAQTYQPPPPKPSLAGMLMKPVMVI